MQRRQKEQLEIARRKAEVRKLMAAEAEEWEAQQRARIQRSERWTTRGQRPLVEPLIMDKEYFFREHVPSDLRFQKLFPGDYEKICKAKDLTAERALLWYYQGWADDCSRNQEVDGPRREFYYGLAGVTFGDYEVVEEEVEKLMSMAGKLALWEFNNLDDDGKTTRIEKILMEDGDAVFAELGDDADEGRKRYGKLLPSQMERFMHRWVDIKNEQEDTSRLEVEMLERRCDDSVLTGWGREVQKKYSHLIPSAITRFNHRYMESDDGIAQMKWLIEWKGGRFFASWDQSIMELYHHLIPGDGSELARFEHQYLDSDRSTKKIEGHMLNVGLKLLRSWGPTVKEKYSHLCPPCEVRFEHQHIRRHEDGTITLSGEFLATGKAVFEGDDSYTDEEKAILKEKNMNYCTDLMQLEYLYIKEDGSTERLQRYFEEAGREEIRREWGEEVLEEWGHFCLQEEKEVSSSEEGKVVIRVGLS